MKTVVYVTNAVTVTTSESRKAQRNNQVMGVSDDPFLGRVHVC